MSADTRLEQRRAAAARGAQVSHARRRAERQELINEIENLIEAGTSPWRIVTALGYTNARSLERRLERAGRYDLAAFVRPPKSQRVAS